MSPARLACLLALLVLSACRGPRDPVAGLLADLETAGEARDGAALEKRITKDFTGAGGMPRAQAVDEARRTLALYQEVRLEIYGVRAQGQERVSFHVDFAGNARSIGGLSSLMPPEATYSFDCELAEEDGLLKIRRAEWKAVAPPGEGGADAPAR